MCSLNNQITIFKLQKLLHATAYAVLKVHVHVHHSRDFQLDFRPKWNILLYLFPAFRLLCFDYNEKHHYHFVSPQLA